MQQTTHEEPVLESPYCCVPASGLTFVGFWWWSGEWHVSIMDRWSSGWSLLWASM